MSIVIAIELSPNRSSTIFGWTFFANRYDAWLCPVLCSLIRLSAWPLSKQLLALLRTRPETVAVGLAVLCYMADWAESNDAGLFHSWSGPLRSAGADFIPTIANAIERGGKSG